MGLECVELAMDVEDEFGISLPDEIAEQIHTVGQLYDVVLPMVRSQGVEAMRQRPDLEEFIWARLCTMSAQLASGVKASEITRDTRFIQDLGYG